MATKKKAPAKKSGKARKPAASAAKKAAAKKSAAAPAKKAPARKVAKKTTRKPATKKAPQQRSSPPGTVAFTVVVGEGYLTLEYDGSPPQSFTKLLFVKDEDERRAADDCIERMAMREIVVGPAKAYGSGP